jgi:succinate dehydrogenase / fumarate reductase iron-sulfur subunit
MKAIIDVKRFNPENDSEEYFQEYEIEVEESSTILDALIKIREDMDGTLALRCSCRASICGSCGMKVNGSAKLVCKTRLIDISPDGEKLQVEPLGNMSVIKDLVVDMNPFWNKVKQIQPYMKPDSEPKGEYIASNESMTHLVDVMNCIMCGACVSDCTALEVDKNFIGPAALAKAYRFVADPRDEESVDRLKYLNKNSGVWDCTRCYACVEVCPKGVAPMERIMKMRDLAISEGFKNTSGYRHTKSFVKSVGKFGRLDEANLALTSVGFFNILGLIDLAIVGIRAFLRGKLPPIIPHKAKSNENIKRIVKKLENK